jgi:hypothetical protein
VIAFGGAAWLLLALAVMLIALSVENDSGEMTLWPTKAVFDWVLSVGLGYRIVAVAVLGGAGTACAVAAVRGYRAS